MQTLLVTSLGFNALGDTDFHRPVIFGGLRLISDCAGNDFSKSRNTEDVAIVRSIVAYSIIGNRCWTALGETNPHAETHGRRSTRSNSIEHNTKPYFYNCACRVRVFPPWDGLTHDGSVDLSAKRSNGGY
jgi:hypothetical protein